MTHSTQSFISDNAQDKVGNSRVKAAYWWTLSNFESDYARWFTKHIQYQQDKGHWVYRRSHLDTLCYAKFYIADWYLPYMRGLSGKVVYCFCLSAVDRTNGGA